MPHELMSIFSEQERAEKREEEESHEGQERRKSDRRKEEEESALQTSVGRKRGRDRESSLMTLQPKA